MATTVERLAEITGGTVARSGDHVIVGYGSIGYLTLRPTVAYLGDVEVPAAEIGGRLRARSGGHHAALRAKLAAAGIRAR